MEIITFQSLPSTNQYCELLDLNKCEEFTIINAVEQTAGIGQRGNHWESEKGKNLTFSIILKPTFLPIADQFQLTKCISLGIIDWLKERVTLEHKVSIKWPNDIYVDHKKICGTLTSAKISRGKISAAISGIGINLNQTTFSDWIPNPVSLIQITRKEAQPETALKEISQAIERRYRQLKESLEAPDSDYLSNLLHLGEKRKYLFHDEIIEATITGTNRYGHLQLNCPNGSVISCQIKEIQWIW